MKLIILRGPSGSGKSTIAKGVGEIAAAMIGVPTHEADEYFVCPLRGVYLFDPSKLGQAHRWCQLEVERDMIHSIPLVVVSNTGTRIKEIQPYIDLAKQYCYPVEVLRTPGPWNPDTLFARNVHGVPLEIIEKQIARYVPHVNETEWTDLSIFRS